MSIYRNFHKVLVICFVHMLCVGCNSNSKNSIKNEVKPLSEEPNVTKPDIVLVHDSSTVELVTNSNVQEKLAEFGRENPETLVWIYTSKGKIKIELFEDTPLHRASFLMLAKAGYFNGTLFTRVVKDFMAQGGSPADYTQVDLQIAIGNYTIPSELNQNYFHKQGMLGAAREYNNNPDKRSDPYNFYLVEGTRFSDQSLDKYEALNQYKFSPEQRQYYTKNSGAAHLDGQHTLFGKIISGYNVVPKLTSVKTDRQDWPLVDIFIDSVVVIH